MRGWITVESEYLRTEKDLAAWVEIGVTYARTLPAK